MKTVEEVLNVIPLETHVTIKCVVTSVDIKSIGKKSLSEYNLKDQQGKMFLFRSLTHLLLLARFKKYVLLLVITKKKRQLKYNVCSNV